MSGCRFRKGGSTLGYQGTSPIGGQPDVIKRVREIALQHIDPDRRQFGQLRHFTSLIFGGARPARF